VAKNSDARVFFTLMARVKKSRRSGYARLSSKHQVTIPKGALEALGLGPGDEFKVEVDRGGRIVLSPAAQTTAMRRAIKETPACSPASIAQTALGNCGTNGADRPEASALITHLNPASSRPTRSMTADRRFERVRLIG